jgi:hypothetical protein
MHLPFLVVHGPILVIHCSFVLVTPELKMRIGEVDVA